MRPSCSPNLSVSGCPAPGFRAVGLLQGASFLRLQSGCGAKGRGTFWCFSFGPWKMAKSWKCASDGKETDGEGPMEAFTIFVIHPDARGQGVTR